MSVSPLTALPISYFRSHTKDSLHRVSHLSEHLLLTAHGKGKACVIPMQDARVLWQLQNRPVHEMEERLRKTYANWLRAKYAQEEWGGVELDGYKWENWSGFEKM